MHELAAVVGSDPNRIELGATDVGDDAGELAAIEHLLRAETLGVVARRHFNSRREGCAARVGRHTAAWVKTAAGGQGRHIRR